MRIRTVKPEFWRSDDIDKLSIEDRLLFIGLWTYVDDEGRGADKPIAIAADLFAGDMERDFSEASLRVQGGLTRLAEAGLIVRYHARGRAYLAVPNWTKHQKINRPTRSRLPAPTEAEDHPQRSLTEDSVSPHESLTPGTGNREQGGSVATHPEEVTPVGEGGSKGEPSRKRSGRTSRGTRLPDDWQPTEDLKQWVRDNCTNLTDRQKRIQTQDFCDYWHAKAGKDANKVNWELTYQRWMRKSDADVGGAGRTGRGGVGSPARSTADERIGALDLYYEPGPEQPQLGD